MTALSALLPSVESAAKARFEPLADLRFETFKVRNVPEEEVQFIDKEDSAQPV
jgi:hypothetical protein